MPAPTHTRPHPATTGRFGTRLPWWALALPTLAFVALLLLLLEPSNARAADDPALAQVVAAVQQALRHLIPQ
ncbi:hypothetical protein [Streptomyces sp. CRN 30]|uniref:hypothetical protein n=1 Tax=Streptomyces sp. CRN 30 TaxID=3075613 RepID=UPI002A7FE47A|nr:hypothetical protein [Streptomyces sp. CRN 30]